MHKKIVIVGAGPVGLATALKLITNGIPVTIIDQVQNNKNDGRVLALSYASYHLFKELGVWPADLATAINQVHISHSGFGVTNINATDLNLTHLGYTVRYTDLCNALLHKISIYSQLKFLPFKVNQVIPGKNFVTISYSANQDDYLTADLVILAEGGNIKIAGIDYNHFDYGKTALIARLNMQKNFTNIAFERFDQTGQMVLLPHGKDYVLVWSVNNSFAKDIISKKVNLLSELVKIPFMKRFAQIELIDNFYYFPLKMQVAKTKVLDKVVLIGNSAQILHPVSAQGLNLGLRDVETLTQFITNLNLTSDFTQISKYAKAREKDSKYISKFTHFLARFLNGENSSLRPVIQAGIVSLSNCKPLQNKIAHSLIFGR